MKQGIEAAHVTTEVAHAKLDNEILIRVAMIEATSAQKRRRRRARATVATEVVHAKPDNETAMMVAMIEATNVLTGETNEVGHAQLGNPEMMTAKEKGVEMMTARGMTETVAVAAHNVLPLSVVVIRDAASEATPVPKDREVTLGPIAATMIVEDKTTVTVVQIHEIVVVIKMNSYQGAILQ